MIKLGVEPSTIGQKVKELQQVHAKWQAWRAHHFGIPSLLSSTPSSVASSSPPADSPNATAAHEHVPPRSQRPRSASWSVLTELFDGDGDGDGDGMVSFDDLPIFGKTMEHGSDSRVVKPTVKKSVSE